jgi:PAS domain S-box-containing protein
MHDNIERLEKIGEKLAREEISLQTMLQGLFVIMTDGHAIVSNDNMTFRSVSKDFAMLFGYSPDELVDKPVETLIPNARHESHREYTDNWLSNPYSLRMDNRNPVECVSKTGDPVKTFLGVVPIDNQTTLVITRRIHNDRAEQR